MIFETAKTKISVLLLAATGPELLFKLQGEYNIKCKY